MWGNGLSNLMIIYIFQMDWNYLVKGSLDEKLPSYELLKMFKEIDQ